jgi:hypothetical protein
MSFSKKEFDQILHEETIKLLSEEGVQEGFLDRIKDLYKRYTKPRPNASQGVGRAFAGYKVPEKKPFEPKQTQQTQQPQSTKAPQTGLATKQTAAMEPSDISGPEYTSTAAKQPSGVYDLDLQKKLPPSQQQALPPDVEPVKNIEPSRQLVSPNKTEQPKQLSAPAEIITSTVQGETVNPKNAKQVTDILNKYKADLASYNIPEIETEIVIKYLIANNRVLANTTRVPKEPEVKEAEVINEITLPSMQQGELSFETLEKYIKDLHYYFKKHHNISIPLIHIHTIMKIIYDDGRLAISPQKMRRMGYNFPEFNIKESKTYKIFYNSWKEYAKTGVIL